MLNSGFFGNFFAKDKLVKGKNNQNLSLQENMPHYKSKIHIQLKNFDRIMYMLNNETDTSLDIILTKTLQCLKESLLQYAKLLEEILLFKKVISLETNARRRNLSELLTLAHDRLHFAGGHSILLTSKFLSDMQSKYLSSIEEKIYVQHIKSVKKELGFLEDFIENK